MKVATTPLEKYIELYNGKLPTENDPNYLELLRMSKYAVLETPYYKPGKCANCGCSKNDGRKYVDFNLEIDWYGKVYLCTLCLDDIVTACGFYTMYKNQIEELKNRVAELETQHEVANKLDESVVKLAEELQEHYARLYPSGDGSSGNVADSGDLSVGNAQNSESGSGTDQTERRIEPAKPGAVKQTSSTRRKDVPSLTELLERPNK